MIRMANWQLRLVLPMAMAAARDAPAHPQLDLLVADLKSLAKYRGMGPFVDAIELRNDEGPPEEGPSRAATTAAEE